MGSIDVEAAWSHDLSTALIFLLAAVCCGAWLTSIVFCAANVAKPLLIVAAAFLPVRTVHGVDLCFDGWWSGSTS
jgi:hypothetical protein